MAAPAPPEVERVTRHIPPTPEPREPSSLTGEDREFTVERVDGPTPRGGAYAEAIKTRGGQIVEITEYDQLGAVIARAYADREGEDTSGASVAARLVEMFDEWGLPTPPIPTRFQSSLQEVEPQCFATNDLTSGPMYLFGTELPLQLLQAQLDDFVAISFGGHGVNSYALSYLLVDGPLAVFLQTGWGGVYKDAEASTSAWRFLVSHVERLLQAAEKRAVVHDRDPAERLLVVNSDFRGGGVWAPVAVPMAEDAARVLLETRYRCEPTGDMTPPSQQALAAATRWAESAWLPQVERPAATSNNSAQPPR